METVEYKYELNKRIYGHGVRKHICPGCNKKTFVPYVLKATGEFAGEDFGRCDREKECGYILYPKANETLTDLTKVIALPKAPVEPSYHSYDLVTESGRNFKQNNFVQFLKTIMSDDEVRRVILTYCLGTSKDGSVIYWQIDNATNSNGHHNVRGGKIMQYVRETGKRYKDANGESRVYWVHSRLKIENYNLQQCLFGLHLINEIHATDNSPIAIVESEKSAIIMSIYKPQYTWLATGGKHGFKAEYLKPLKNRSLIAFPDKSEFETWEAKAKELNKQGYKITVSRMLEDDATLPDGADLADVAIPLLKERMQKPRVIDLSKYTQAEQIAYELEQKNPALRLLINTFDLTDQHGKAIQQIN